MKNKMIKKIGFVFFVLTICLTHLKAQGVRTETIKKEVVKMKSPFSKINKDKIFKPIVGLESWATYSINEKKNGKEYKNRADFSFRRIRFGACGNPYSWLSYSFQFTTDRLGEDCYASTKGSYNGLNLWNAYITAKLLKNSEFLNIHAGYFWAAISREYNTSPWAIGSFDKTRACWYMRNFITGTGNGIESGIAIGGLKNVKNFGISYRIGTYEPEAYSSAEYACRLYTGRLMFSFGDPEQVKYKYMLSGNQWRKRNGVTLGFGASTQSDGRLTDTLYFDKSIAYGADILINYKGLRIDGEYFKFNRTAKNYKDYNGTQWHVLMGYSFKLGKQYLEPTVTCDEYEGEGTKALFKHIGDDNTFDAGVNWYLNKDKLKLALHYVIQDGSASSNTGDYIGFSCQLKL